MPLRYVGNGPYCTANSLTVIFGDDGPGPAAIEVLSGTPFGMSLQGADLPYWGPIGWTPEIGIATVLDLLGWACDCTSGSPEDAVAKLRQASRTAPALAGPVEMGLLPYIPGLGQAIGADHVVVVIGVEGDLVRAHDVQGWPFVTMPIDALLAAWQGDSFVYPVDPYVVRTNFRREREVDTSTALRRSLPNAVQWLEKGDSGAAAERLADIVEKGLTNLQHKYLVEFTVQGGARRLADAAVLLEEIGCAEVASVLDQQAMLIGSLQLPLVQRDSAAAAAILRKLAPTYEQLRRELVKEIST
jgi:hypothetical protein